MWKVIQLTVAALVFLAECQGQNTESPCKNGGTCSVKTDDGRCTTCICVAGYSGNTCEEVLTKIDGVVTYKSSNQTFEEISFDEQGFKSLLEASVPNYRDSTTANRSSENSPTIRVNYVVYITRPSDWSNFNQSFFISTLNNALKQPSSVNGIFTNVTSAITVSSATADIDECASQLYKCDVNAECFNTQLGYGCTCKSGYMGNGTHCPIGIFCKLSNAPEWPTSATRNVYYHNGAPAKLSSLDDNMPYKTYIEYKCPERYTLVNSLTGEAQTTVIECVGTNGTTPENKGWTGNAVRCDMKLEFMVAIVMAVVSSAIIVMVAGAFIVSCTNERKKKEANNDNDTDILDLS